MKTIVVLGAGNWVKGQYARALRPYRERKEHEQCGVFFIYDSGYASTTDLSEEIVEHYNASTKRNVAAFKKWKATCLDRAKPEEKEKIGGIVADVVFVVTPDNTHCDMVEEWLERAGTIIVEKPFDDNHERIRQLRNKIDDINRNRDEDKQVLVWGFDHYLVRANQFVTMKAYLGFNEHMEKRIHEFRFHMLEPTDEGLEERAASLQEGMILDMGSHVPALVLPFGNPNTIRFNTVKAGVYEANPDKGIHTSGHKLFTSGMETFAEIQFTFVSVFGQEVKATACIGKCVGDQPEKYVEVIGGEKKDRKVRLDFRNYVVDFFGGENPGPVTSLFPDPVYLLVREVLEGEGRHPDSLALFGPEAGQDFLARLAEWRQPILNLVKGKNIPLQGYRAGTPLDDILITLQPL